MLQSIRYYTQTPLAAVTVNGEIVFRGEWALAQTKKKQYMRNYPGRVEIHKARHLKGIAYCQQCGCATKDPYLATYERTDYWKCKCNKINFLRMNDSAVSMR